MIIEQRRLYFIYAYVIIYSATSSRLVNPVPATTFFKTNSFDINKQNQIIYIFFNIYNFIQVTFFYSLMHFRLLDQKKYLRKGDIYKLSVKHTF